MTMSRRLLPALLGVVALSAAAAGAAAAPEACRGPAQEAEAPGLLLVQAKPAGLSRLHPHASLASVATTTSSTTTPATTSHSSGDEVQCLFNQNVTLTSHRIMQLQDNGGLLNLFGNKGPWEQWTIHDAGDGKVRIMSQFGKYLGDDNAVPGLIDEGHDATKWSVTYAGHGQVFLTSHRNEHLGDWEGILTMHGNMGEWERWYVNTLDGGLACTSAQAEGDELQSLRERMLHAEALLEQARELVAAGCSTTMTTTPRNGDIPELGRCAIFGDPHFITFDGGHTTFVGDRILWVVRSQNVWMQAVSRLATGNFMGFAVGGPFLQGHTLLVYNASDGGALRAEFDGVPILLEAEDEFESSDIGLKAIRSPSWNASLHDSAILDIRTEQQFAIGPFPERFTGSPEGGLFLLRLPGHVEVTITGVDFMSAVVSMPAQATGQSGYCGDFNNDAEDDYAKVAPSWNRPVGRDLGPVPRSMSLFEHISQRSVLGFLDASPAESQESRQPVECTQELQAQAEAECQTVEDLRLRQDCIFDICQTGAVSAVQGMLAAEVLETKVNAHGTVSFMGHGRCLSAQGTMYGAFPTTDVRTDADCKQLLRELAFTRGVMGAELRRTSTCQILVDGDVDLTATIVSGRWQEGGMVAPTGADGEAMTRGTGMVTGWMEDPAWSCWTVI